MQARSSPTSRRQSLLRRVALVALASAVLASCQQIGGTRTVERTSDPAAVAAPGWRVVERIGEVRFRAPGGSAMTVATPGGTIAAGSLVTTGRGGRLIVSRAGRQIAAGTGARFTLPAPPADDALAQDAGRLLYRLAGAPLHVATPALRLEGADGVFSVTVEARGTEVEAESGRVRVAALGGRRTADLGTGETARRPADGAHALLVRRSRGGAFEPVPPATVAAPALADVSAVLHGASVPGAELPEESERPRIARTGAEGSPPARAEVDGARPRHQGAAVAVVPAGFRPDHARGLPNTEAGTGAVAEADRDVAGAAEVARGAPDADPAPAEPVAPDAAPSDPFDRLTGGLLQSLPAVPTPAEPRS